MDKKKKLEWSDSEITDYAVQLFLDSLPSLKAAQETENSGNPHLEMTMEERGNAHLKMAGLLPAADEERLHLMQTVMGLSEEEATKLLDKMKARRKQ